jgi:hypothetical protein
MIGSGWCISQSDALCCSDASGVNALAIGLSEGKPLLEAGSLVAWCCMVVCLSADLDLLKICRGCCFCLAAATLNVVVVVGGVARNDGLSLVYQLRGVQRAYGKRPEPQRESSLG